MFLKCIRRANINSLGFEAKGVKFTPGWSISYYFIPILNLFKPSRAMKEILQIRRDPRGWFYQPGGQSLGLWCAVWLLSGVMARISTKACMKVESITDYQAASNLSIMNEGVSIVLIIVAGILVNTIASNQENLVRKGEGE